MLEVIDKGRCTDRHPVPLLFVHGAAHAAWCWGEHFLDFFADKGFRAIAPSLRGHGGSPTSKPLRACSVADFVEDLVSVANDLPATPVVVGHSQGGFVVQKYLESHAAPAAVLIASTPPQGAAAGLLRFAASQLRATAQHPWLSTKAAITGKTLPAFEVTDASVRDAFFCSLTPDAEVSRYKGAPSNRDNCKGISRYGPSEPAEATFDRDASASAGCPIRRQRHPTGTARHREVLTTHEQKSSPTWGMT